MASSAPLSLPSWPAMLVAVVATFAFANLVAGWLRRKRMQRIGRKLDQLCNARLGGRRTPVTVITGFLGSGKTTLVNHMLANPGGRRIAVVENEVGAISIDHKLLRDGPEGNPADGVFVLKNGCMCCSGASGSGQELERILDQLLSFVTEEYSYVVIELSGLADPGPVVRAFFRAEMDKSRFYLDGVVAVVDSKHIGFHLAAGGMTARTKEAQSQVACADVVLLNKVDLLSPPQVQDAERLVRSVNATASLVRTRHSVVDLQLVLGIQAFSLERVALARATAAADSDGATTGGSHSSGVSSVSLTLRQPVSQPRLLQWLQGLVQAHWQDLFRLKGIIDVAGRDQQYVVQGVHAELLGGFGASWRAAPSSAAAPTPSIDHHHHHDHAHDRDHDHDHDYHHDRESDAGARCSQLVFIGRHLDPAALRAGFEACVATHDGDVSGEVPQPHAPPLRAQPPAAGVRRRGGGNSSST